MSPEPAQQMEYRYICIEGNIGAGKTTLATILAEMTGSRLILEEFEENPFLELFYQDPERYALQTELTFLADRYKQLSAQLVHPSLFEPSVISDYHLFKSRLFAQNNLKEQDFRLYARLFSIVEAALPRPDLMLFLYHEPVDLIRNIRKRGRSYEQDISAQYLESLQKAYLTYIYHENRFPILLINMKGKDFIGRPEETGVVADLLGQRFNPGLTISDV